MLKNKNILSFEEIHHLKNDDDTYHRKTSYTQLKLNSPPK